MACAPFARLVNMHGVTNQKICLDTAFIEIIMGLKQDNRTLSCAIDGTNFTVQVEEVKE